MGSDTAVVGRRFRSDSEKRKLVLRQSASGKTLAGFCRAEGVALSSFQNWKKHFADMPAFVEVAPSVQTASASVEVVLAAGDRVVTSSDCDPAWLARLVHLLGRPQC
jgi:hypothetical protein